MTLKEFYADRGLDFLRNYAPDIIEKAQKVSGNYKQLIKSILIKHMEFETIVIIWDSGEIVGMCRFNLNNNEAYILDCVVRPDYRFKNILRKMTMVAISRWPSIKNLVFERRLKQNNGEHCINVGRFLKCCENAKNV